MKKSIAYEKLALIYEHVMRRVNYSDWSDYIYCITQKYVKDDPFVLELAGGNCNLANYLSTYYRNIVVTDSSRWMLLNDSLNVLPKVCCDMSLLPFKNKFDLVYSTFDSVNYLTSEKKLQRLFYEVRNVLTDDGIFTFDVSLEKNSYVHVRQPLRKGSYKGIKYIHQTEFDEKRKIHRNIFKIEFDDGSTFREIHKQKIYMFEDYFKLMDKAGLYTVECYEGFTFKNAKPSSARAQFIVKKDL